MPKTFIPVREWKPDLGIFGNDGMVTADGVVPISGHYAVKPVLKKASQVGLPASPTGMHIHSSAIGIVIAGASTISQNYVVYFSTNEAGGAQLYELATTAFPWVRTNVSRAAPAYAAVNGEFGWQFASFGDIVVATNLVDNVQFRASGAALFADMITSTFNPRAALVAPIKGNLFLAACEVLAPHGKLAAGIQPNLVVWSQNNNVQAFGDPSLDLSLAGVGYNFIQNDAGELTGFVGGEWGMIQQTSGFVKIEGPPYTFRTVVRGRGSVFPNAVTKFDGDIYFWGDAGPARLPGGEGPVENLAHGSVQRSMLDYLTGFSDISLDENVVLENVTVARDPKNNLIMWSVSVGVGLLAKARTWCYNTVERRWSTWESAESTVGNKALIRYSMDRIPLIHEFDIPFGVVVLAEDTLGDIHAYLVTSDPAESANIPSVYNQSNLGWPAVQLDQNFSTRVSAVRPVFRSTDNRGMRVRATVNSYNRPYETPVSDSRENYDADDVDNPTYENQDDDPSGWIPIPESSVGDFHQIDLRFTRLNLPAVATIQNIVEIEGIEVEYSIMGKAAA